MRLLRCAERGSLLLVVCTIATAASALSTVPVAAAGIGGAGAFLGCGTRASEEWPALAICDNDPFAVTWIARSRPGTIGRIAKPARVRLVVGFGRQLNAQARAATLKRLGLTLLQTLPQLRAVVVSLPALSAQATLARLAASPSVAYAERDRSVHAALAPNDPYFAPFDGSTGDCASDLDCWAYQNADLAPAWDVTTGSSAVTVAVIDTGVDPTQPDLQGDLLTGCNLVSGTITAGVCSDTDTTDDYGHGTEAAGVIAARINNGIGVPGVCGECQILPVKALDQLGNGSTANVALGITWAADHGADVISLSLAGGYADPLEWSAVSYAIGKGVLVVAAAGNGGSNSPAAYPGGYPGAFTGNADANGDAAITSGLISVGATDYFKSVDSFSNYGSWVTVTAPGCSPAVLDDGTFNDTTDAFCGTSAATPFVAGTAALLLSYDPSLTPAQLQADITSSATPVTERLSVGGGDSVACNGGNPCTASGQLDAYGALEAAGYTPPPVAPANSDAPSLVGSLVDGQTLTGTQGNWTGSATISYSYAWARCDAAGGNCSETGTTSTDYTLSPADVAQTLRLTVTATNGVGSTSASVTSGVVSALGPSVISGPTVSGSSTPTLGDVLTAAHGSWNGTPTMSYSYQWQRSSDGSTAWSDISSATSPHYTVSSSDQDNYLRVKVTASNGGGSADAYSAASGQSVFAPANTGLPLLSGTLRAGQTLAASTGVWVGSEASYSYQWETSEDGSSGWSEIADETGATYNIRSADIGSYLRVVVSSTNSAGSDSADSAASTRVLAALVTPPNVTPPEISGSAAVNAVLVGFTGNWTGGTSIYTYQWSSSTDDLSWSDIAGATAATYTVQPADLGDYLRLTVTALTDSGGSAQADSGPTGQVVSAGSGGGGSGGGGGGGSAAASDFKLLLSSDQPTAVEGSQIIWRMTISDKYGTASASGVNVTITLPPGLTFTQTSTDRGPGCAHSGQTVLCNLDYIAPGLDGHIILWTQVNAAGDQTLTAAVRHSGPEANPSDDQSTLTVPARTTTNPPTAPPPKKTPTVRLHAAITGRALTGHRLSIESSGNATILGYQWELCRGTPRHLTCTALRGARSRSLLVRPGDVGSKIRAVISYLNGKHHDQLTTATTTIVKA